MKFFINQIILLERLQKIQGPTSFKQNFPILNCILIEAKGQVIKFTTTDLNTTIIKNIKGLIEEEGIIAVQAKHFISIIRELPSKEITFELIKNNLFIRCEKIEFKINTINPADFPHISADTTNTLIKLNPL